MFDSVSHQREHAVVIKRIEELKAELASCQLEASRSEQLAFKVGAIEQAATQLQQLAPREFRFDIGETFGEYMYAVYTLSLCRLAT